MASFGEDLRKERLSRGLKLENINAITKISLSHLLALEQNRFRLLPGGILNKGIVRGYAGALGLDPQAWTERFLEAYSASGLVTSEEPDWTAFASNVGRVRILRHDAAEERLRWLGASVLLFVVTAAGILTLRYVGLRAGWWPSFLPFHAAHHVPVRAAVSSMRPLVIRVSSLFGH
jgi:cytoskeletal protein RodZ